MTREGTEQDSETKSCLNKQTAHNILSSDSDNLRIFEQQLLLNDLSQEISIKLRLDTTENCTYTYIMQFVNQFILAGAKPLIRLGTRVRA